MLFDTGTEGAIFIRNCRNLGLDLGTVEEIAITHGHWDHMGALPAAIDAIVARRGRGAVTVHVNPGMFNERGVLLKSGVIFPAARVPTPVQMEGRGAKVVNDGAARLLLDGHFYYSGEIPRVSAFETGRQDHLCRRDNSEEWRPDPYLMDERMLVANVRDLGLIVFSACSHAGIVNVCTEVRRLFPDVPVHAVMGGLHLGGVMEHLIPQTVDGLKPFDIGYLIAGHCTGWRALHALADAYGERVSQSAVGTSYLFDASAPPAAA
jgi:7,8-dihydropterin-6-yl-methyl-4-(beta-D-ribofuranosyl)aminobenzene 5'-phosphate synthase